MGMMRVRTGFSASMLGVGLAVLVLCTSPLANADGGVNADALQMSAAPPVGASGVDAATYAALFAGVPSDPPTGAIVADSGFRPFPNGFSFVNYGTQMGMNQRLFAQPGPLAAGAAPTPANGLTVASMRRVFGDGVCLPGSGDRCTLTESAKVVMSTANSWAAAGHCFGFATVANALYTGRLAPSEVAGGMVNNLTTLNPSTQQAIMRAFIAQYFSAVGIRPTSMSDAITRLRSSLAPGQIPYTMLVYGAPGGHAMVPYAVLDKGNGLFDIAVYDPNLPNQARAVHVDTNANSWSFTSTPGLSTSTWSSSDPVKPAYFLLGDVNSALSKQACTFCSSGKSGTLVSFSPVLSANGGVFDNIVLTDSAGTPLDPALYRLIPPTSESGSPYFSGPVLEVNASVNFDINLSGESVETVQPFSVTVVSPGSTRSLKLETLNSETRGRIRVGILDGGLSFAGIPTNKGTVTHTFEENRASYNFRGIETTDYHLEAMDFRSYQLSKRVVFKENDAFASVWSVRVSSETSRGKSSYVAKGVKVGPGSQLAVTYSGWAGTKGKPILWLDKGSNGSLDTRIPLRLA